MMNIPIRPHNENRLIHSQVLAISTTHIRTYSAINLLFQKALDDRPWLDEV
jgi:hypothetical protein